MRDFAALYRELDETTRTSEKQAALARYFASADPADAIWAVYFLSGRRIRQALAPRLLARWAAELADIDEWLFEECYSTVGDLAETVTLLLPPPTGVQERLFHRWIDEILLPLRSLEEDRQRDAVIQAWFELPEECRLVWNKLLTGQFRAGVSQQLVARALAEVTQLPTATVVRRLAENWKPTAAAYRQLVLPETEATPCRQPYLFSPASQLEQEPESLGSLSEWLAEWKWDGIRAQILKHDGAVTIWSRGDVLLTETLPEISAAVQNLPDGTILDGVILAIRNGAMLPLSTLQRRVDRKKPSKAMLAEVPASFLGFDLLEDVGIDWRERPLAERRARLEQHLVSPMSRPATSMSEPLMRSPGLVAATWEELAELREVSREWGAEGLMLKRLTSPYRTNQEHDDWWAWKVDPLTAVCVLLYVQAGDGRGANRFNEYTFAVWEDDLLVPIAKTGAGVTDEEIAEIDRFVRENTREKFGPVRSVTPELVFELAFDAIEPSTRHKAGLTVRFPRIVRWRKDMRAEQADSLQVLRQWLRDPPADPPAHASISAADISD
ncbi:MAG: ATP-dependent DNA ligase [Planctomycetaceae bacterium]|nr:ATP-dependent DNA ligase [Planctomycetaceae bacterium]